MAVVNAANTGNWSSSSTWPGGVFPTGSDDVYANGKIVTINQDITVNSLNTTAGTGGVAGGGFTLNSGFTINCAADITAGTTSCVSATFSSPSTGTINAANVRGSTSSANCRGVSSSGSGIITMTANVIGGTAAGANGLLTSGNLTLTGNVTATVAAGINFQGATSRTVVITGNVSASTVGVSVVDVSSGSGSITINGNVTAGSVDSANALVIGTTGYTVTVNGNVSGSSGGSTSASASGIRVAATTAITVNGDVYGGSGAGARGILYVAGNGQTLTVNGDVVGGTAPPYAHGISINNVSGTVTINGAVIGKASTAITDFDNTLQPLIEIKGPFIQFNDSSMWPVAASNVKLISTTAADNYVEIYDTSDALVTLYSEDFATDLPDEEDVREGVVFGGSMEGTLAVPLPSQVSLGIPTDDTVGTGVVTAEDVWNVDRADLDTSDSIGERLKNAATVATVGDQLAALD